MTEPVTCPNCGNTENFHFNYDYTQANLPVQDVLCNECGEIFDLTEEYDEDNDPYENPDDFQDQEDYP